MTRRGQGRRPMTCVVQVVQVVSVSGETPRDDFSSGNDRFDGRRHGEIHRRGRRSSSSDNSESARRDRSRSGQSDQREHGRYRRSGGSGQHREDERNQRRRRSRSSEHRQDARRSVGPDRPDWRVREQGPYNQRGRHSGNRGSYRPIRAPSGNWRDPRNHCQETGNRQPPHFWPRGGGVRLGGWGSRAQGVDRILQQATARVKSGGTRQTISEPMEIIAISDDEDIVEVAPPIPNTPAGNTAAVDIELVDISDDELSVQVTPQIPRPHPHNELPVSHQHVAPEVEAQQQAAFEAAFQSREIAPQDMQRTELESYSVKLSKRLEEVNKVLAQWTEKDVETGRLNAQVHIPTAPVVPENMATRRTEPEVMASPPPTRHQEREPPHCQEQQVDGPYRMHVATVPVHEQEAESEEEAQRAAGRAGMEVDSGREPLEEGEIEEEEEEKNEEAERRMDQAGIGAASGREPSEVAREMAVGSPHNGHFRNATPPSMPLSPPPTRQWEREMEAEIDELAQRAADRVRMARILELEAMEAERLRATDFNETFPSSRRFPPPTAGARGRELHPNPPSTSSGAPPLRNSTFDRCDVSVYTISPSSSSPSPAIYLEEEIPFFQEELLLDAQVQMAVERARQQEARIEEEEQGAADRALMAGSPEQEDLEEGRWRASGDAHIEDFYDPPPLSPPPSDYMDIESPNHEEQEDDDEKRQMQWTNLDPQNQEAEQRAYGRLDAIEEEKISEKERAKIEKEREKWRPLATNRPHDPNAPPLRFEPIITTYDRLVRFKKILAWQLEEIRRNPDNPMLIDVRLESLRRLLPPERQNSSGPSRGRRSTRRRKNNGWSRKRR